MKREEGSWEREKNFSKPATPWGSRKKIFYVRHVVGKSEKDFLRPPRRGEV